MHELNVNNVKEFKDHAMTMKKFTYQTAWRKLDEASLAKAYQKENATTTQHEPPRTLTKMACVECGLRTLNPDGTVSPAPGVLTIIASGDAVCRKGHDLSKGRYISYDNSASFTDEPLPVKIP